ncbi:MAG: hypothetical protein ACXW05_19840 [Gemmatirosa sp.]
MPTTMILRHASRAAFLLSLFLSTPAAASAGQDCPPLTSMDERAQCVLGTPAGRRALPAVGVTAPADLEGKRAHAALTPSFNRYVIRQAGVDRARLALEAATADAYARHTGRTLAEWHAEWVKAIGGTTGG